MIYAKPGGLLMLVMPSDFPANKNASVRKNAKKCNVFELCKLLIRSQLLIK